ncbi:MAG: zinc ABC transporter substrate-binding protein [Candidatus Micrarchaeota archaeon]|nr:zinc ABC transporter substrate-binding protein [Candidatus Micrarchaeota archaeon]
MAKGNRIAVTAGVMILIVAIAAVGIYSLIQGRNSLPSTTTGNQSNHSSGHGIRIVAAENFWGSIISQLCGVRCNVTSIVTDPNADPHAYEASAFDARVISNARLVVVNGVGYDDWALKLLSAGNSQNQTVLNVAGLLGVQNGSNPHLWYSPYYVNATARQMYLDLVKIDPPNATYYAQQYSALNASLKQVDGRMAEIRQRFGGTRVAATEDIFVYLANATGLDLVSPPEFMKAVAEGNDPSVQSVAEFENQLENGNLSVLVYNEQTVTPLTTQMKQIAADHNITIVGITETIQPPDVTYQTWMNAELLGLQDALSANALGK